ncbi:MAG: hypothetical protein EAZ06_02545 [Cytophagales bacterium]|nr:MAG: hypothetical protein EAZ06_02545 [Cytophagales bacterium]
MFQKILFLSLSILFLVCFGTYFFYGNQWIQQTYQNKPPFFLNWIIEVFYPRFWTEKHRFSVDFFINKANQVIVRLFLVIVLCFSSWTIWQYNFYQIPSKIKKYFNATIQKQFTNFLVIWFSLLMLYVAHDWLFIFQKLSQWKDFYQPVFLLKIFGKNFPPLWILSVVWSIWLTSTLFLLFFKSYRIITSTISATIFIFLQGFLYSFHKIDHPFVLLNYCLFLLPFLLYEYKKTNLSDKLQKSWALKIMQLSMVSAYFLAGIEKILIGGITWLEPNNIRNHILNHQTLFGLSIINSDFICVILGILGILFEILFPLIVFFKDLRYFFLGIGAIFHLANFFILGVGGVFHPWIILYVIWFEDIGLNNKKV